MKLDQNVNLSSAEFSQLWNAYMNDSMSICVLKYFINKAEDTEIKTVLKYALKLAQSHTSKLTEIFKRENFPIPYGFSEKDVNIDVPRLFSDKFFLNHIHYWGLLGLDSYSLSLGLSVHPNVKKYFSECIDETRQLLNKTKSSLQSKGVYIPAPYLSTPDKAEFIEKQSFLAGWFEDRRPLTFLEIANLYVNMQRNVLAIATCIGFGQVAQSKEVSQYMWRGKEIASKHIEIFSSILNESDVPAPMPWDSGVTDSKIPPFSDKLMMFQLSGLVMRGIGFYGTSLSTSSRRDLSLQYIRMINEILLYSEDSANIMIKNGWMEKPPQASDHGKPANNK
jgi:hypothetical protein